MEALCRPRGQCRRPARRVHPRQRLRHLAAREGGPGGCGPGAPAGAGGRRAVDAERVRPHPDGPRQARRPDRRPHRHHRARRHPDHQSRRLRQSPRPVPPPGTGRCVPGGEDPVGAEMVGPCRRAAYRAGHRREQLLPDARRPRARGTAVRHAAATTAATRMLAFCWSARLRVSRSGRKAARTSRSIRRSSAWASPTSPISSPLSPTRSR